MDPLEGIPVKILGFGVKTRWQISFHYLIPCAIELLVYISLMVIDGATVYQHLLDRKYLFAWLTLGIVFVPAVLTFFCVMLSDQWPTESGCGSEKWKFFARQSMNLLLFPFCAVYRWVINRQKIRNFTNLCRLGFHEKYFGASNRFSTRRTLMRDTKRCKKPPNIHPSNFTIFFSRSFTPRLR